jgi:hypothetical protein
LTLKKQGWQYVHPKPSIINHGIDPKPSIINHGNKGLDSQQKEMALMLEF